MDVIVSEERWKEVKKDLESQGFLILYRFVFANSCFVEDQYKNWYNIDFSDSEIFGMRRIDLASESLTHLKNRR